MSHRQHWNRKIIIPPLGLFNENELLWWFKIVPQDYYSSIVMNKLLGSSR